MKIQAYAANAAREKLQPWSYEAAPLGVHEIEVEITHCGICHSDIHLIDNDWGISRYPLVPGHEIVGNIRALGSDVRHLQNGDRVGIGWQRGACLTCEFCIRGEENLCSASQPTCVGSYGGFARRLRMDSRFAFRIPDRLESENAAPLLCGGITVYSPLVQFNVQPHDRVGVIGIGGLGHLALQFAAKWGCEVTAFSSTAGKEAEARSFGATKFVRSDDPKSLAKAESSLDFIISTVHSDLDWNAYLKCLRPNGTLCFVGAAAKPLEISVFSLIGPQKSIVGSNTGGRARIQDMLEFAARHGIQAKTEVVRVGEINDQNPDKNNDEINGAVERVRKGQARYRMVLQFS